MILGFKEQFEGRIKNGSKIHTIREDKHNRWKPGMTIHFAKGVRTKNYKQFHQGQCVSVQSIKIKYTDIKPFEKTIIVLIDNRILSLNEISTLAVKDGFKSVFDFYDWFNKDFKGKIIHWTNLRY